MLNLNIIAMKTKRSNKKSVITIAALLLFACSMLYADGETTNVYLSGKTNTPAGDYVVQATDALYYFQGKVYEVYRIDYEDPRLNMKIAVNIEGNCTSFVAYNGQFSFFYNCNKYGFGVRKVMFANPWVKDQFSSDEYYCQTILKNQKRIEKKEAIGIVASYVPMLYRWGNSI